MARDQKVKTKAVQDRPQESTQEDRSVASSPRPTAAVESSLGFKFPQWPTSKPGPRVAPIPVGMVPMNRFRPEQVRELDHDQSADSVTDSSSSQTTERPVPKNRKRN